MLELDLSVVTFAPDRAMLRALFASLAEPAAGVARHLFVEDNSEIDSTPLIRGVVAEIADQFGPFASVRVERTGENVGFGRGQNANAARGHAPWILVINQDCVVEPGALEDLAEAATKAPKEVAALEMRQIP